MPRKAEYKKILGSPGLTVQTNVEVIEHSKQQGAIGSRILDIAEKEGVSLIIMGARGKSLHDLFLGSVSTYVLYHATVPLLLVKYPPADSRVAPAAVPASPPVFSKVLIPTDFSAPAEEVLRFVKSMLGINEIILLTQPGHMQKIAAKVLEAQERDSVRADFLRKCFAAPGVPPHGSRPV